VLALDLKALRLRAGYGLLDELQHLRILNARPRHAERTVAALVLAPATAGARFVASGLLRHLSGRWDLGAAGQRCERIEKVDDDRGDDTHSSVGMRFCRSDSWTYARLGRLRMNGEEPICRYNVRAPLGL
jgi:hypothetical protein